MPSKLILHHCATNAMLLLIRWLIISALFQQEMACEEVKYYKYSIFDSTLS